MAAIAVVTTPMLLLIRGSFRRSAAATRELLRTGNDEVVVRCGAESNHGAQYITLDVGTDEGTKRRAGATQARRLEAAFSSRQKVCSIVERTVRERAAARTISKPNLMQGAAPEKSQSKKSRGKDQGQGRFR